jgi:AbrB family looped-hinge helix DNA binding protein
MARRELYGTKMTREGRVLIPAAVRKALNLRTGESMVWVYENNSLVLKSRRALEQELWGSFAEVKGSLASELIAERRQEAAREK